MSNKWYPKTKTMTFEDDKEVICEIVDLDSPEFDQLLQDASLYIKQAEVQARQVTTKEEVKTPLDATTSIANAGDWIVTNPGGERYTVADDVFQKAYKAKPGQPGIFVAVGIPVKAIQVNRNIVFKAPWGEDQAVEAGGYIVERQDNQERYGIEEEAFLTTYQPKK